jgi:hypothetical protein
MVGYCRPLCNKHANFIKNKLCGENSRVKIEIPVDNRLLVAASALPEFARSAFS